MKPIEYDYHSQIINYYIGVASTGERLVHTISDSYNQTEELTASFVYNQISDDYPQLTSMELMQLINQKYRYQIKHVTIDELQQMQVQNYLQQGRN